MYSHLEGFTQCRVATYGKRQDPCSPAHNPAWRSPIHIMWNASPPFNQALHPRASFKFNFSFVLARFSLTRGVSAISLLKLCTVLCVFGRPLHPCALGYYSQIACRSDLGSPLNVVFVGQGLQGEWRAKSFMQSTTGVPRATCVFFLDRWICCIYYVAL